MRIPWQCLPLCLACCVAALFGLPAVEAPAAPAVELTLTQVIERAVANTRSRIALQRAQAERLRLAIPRAALLPQVDGFGTAEHSRDYSTDSGLGNARGPESEWRAGVQVEQPLIDFSAWRILERAEHRVDELDAERARIEDEQALLAAEAWIELAKATDLVEARSEDERLATVFAELAKAQVQAGVAETIDALRADAIRVEANGARLQVVQQQRRAAVQVFRAMDLPQDGSVPRPTGGLPVTPAEDIDVVLLMNQALAARPEMVIAAAGLAAVEAELAAIRQARLPRLALVGEAGVRGSEIDDTGEVWRVGLDLSIPILDGLSYGPRVEAAHLDLVRLRLVRDDAAAAIAAAVQTTVHDLASAISREVVTAQGLELSRQELELAEERFRVGVASNLDLVAAQRAFARARSEDITARHDRALAVVRLAAATGRLHSRR